MICVYVVDFFSQNLLFLFRSECTDRSLLLLLLLLFFVVVEVDSIFGAARTFTTTIEWGEVGGPCDTDLFFFVRMLMSCV